MATPNSADSSFSIGGKDFYTYSAQDAHGTCMHYWAVNGKRVTLEEYRTELNETMRSQPWFKEVNRLCIDTYLGVSGIKPQKGEPVHHLAAKKD